jgi:MFS family permease
MSNRSAVDPATDAPSLRPARGSLLVVFLTVFIDLLGFGLVLPLLPVYGDQFAIDPRGWQLGVLMASFSLMQFVFAPIWGNLSDRFGRRPILMVGLAGSAVFYLLFAVATLGHSFTLLLISRFGAGIAGATIPTAQAYIADCTPPEKRAHGMALIGLAFGMGFTFGPLIGMLAVPAEGEPPGAGPGFFACGLSLMALLSAVFLLPESLVARGAGRRKIIDWSAVAAVRRSAPLMCLLLTLFAFVFSFSKFETTLSLLLKGSEDIPYSPFHFSWRQLCLTYALIGFTLALIQGGVVRPLSKRLPETRLALTGIAVEVLGFVIVTLAIQRQSIGWLFAALVVVVIGFSFLQPSIHSLISRYADPARQGMVMGLAQSVNALGRIVGSGIAIPLLKFTVLLPYTISLVLLLAVGGLIVYATRFPLPASGRSGSPQPGSAR